MEQLIGVLRSIRFEPIAILDIALTAILIYGLFSLIRGTRAVTLVIGVIALYAVYAVAQFLGLELLSRILETGAVVGLLALVVVFQPELRRALERIGRVGSFGWLLSPGAQGEVDRTAAEIADAAARLSAERLGALIVIERETGLQDTAETGVMLHADLSAELLRSIFANRSPLHDGAVIVHRETVLAAGAVLPLPETSVHAERFGTRHRAALGITEQTDAVAVVVSEESGAISLVERARIIRNLDRDRLAGALAALLAPGGGPRGVFRLPAPTRPMLERDFRAPFRRLRRVAPSEPAVAAGGTARETGATTASERR